jgi:hypothetical protein
VNDRLRRGTLRVSDRGGRLTISSHVNPIWSWTSPVFVGRIDRGVEWSVTAGHIRPSRIGLLVGASPVVVPTFFVASEHYLGGAVMFGVLAAVIWSTPLRDRNDTELARTDIAEFLRSRQAASSER